MAVTNDLIPDFDDFERYYGRQMPAAEQRALEGRMLDEPLVAEAYEGFLAWRATHPDVAGMRSDLHVRLHERIARERRRALPLWTYASAASVLLALFAYWTVFLKDSQVVRDKHMAAAPPAETAKPDQVPEPEPARAKDLLAKAPQPTVDQSLKSPFSTSTKSGNGKVMSGIASGEPVSDPETLLKSDAAIAVAERGVTQEQIAVPLADSGFAPIKPSQPATETVNKLTDLEILQEMHKSVAARSTPASSKPSAMSRKTADVLSNSPGKVLNEVVVLGATTQAKKSTSAYLFEPDRPAPAPLGGWEAYRTYLEENTDSSAIAGQITITFIVSASGALSGFVAQGPEALQKEAVRIIRSGPAWAPARTKGMPVISSTEIRLQFRQAQ